MPLNTDTTTANNIDLTTITPANGNTVTKPDPQDAGAVATENKMTVQQINTDLNVSYTPIATSDEVTNESLNRTAETLKASINLKLTTMKESMNEVLQDIGNDHSDQIIEINNKFSGLITAVNQGFADVRTKSVTQTDDILALLNNKVGSVMTEMSRVLEVAENSQAKLASLDETYGTNSDFANRVASVNALIDTLSSSDLDFFTALDNALDELNGLARIKFKNISVNAASGNYSFDLASEGWSVFGSEGDYRVEAVSELDSHKQMRVSGKSGTGFTISVVSKDKHYLPQFIDCSTVSVPVFVRVTHENGSPLGFSTTRLVDSGGDTATATVGSD